MMDLAIYDYTSWRDHSQGPASKGLLSALGIPNNRVEQVTVRLGLGTEAQSQDQIFCW